MAIIMISQSWWQPFCICICILHTLWKILSYAYINSNQSTEKVCTPIPPYRPFDRYSSWLVFIDLLIRIVNGMAISWFVYLINYVAIMPSCPELYLALKKFIILDIYYGSVSWFVAHVLVECIFRCGYVVCKVYRLQNLFAIICGSLVDVLFILKVSDKPVLSFVRPISDLITPHVLRMSCL